MLICTIQKFLAPFLDSQVQPIPYTGVFLHVFRTKRADLFQLEVGRILPLEDIQKLPVS